MSTPPRGNGAGRALWWRFVGTELRRGLARAATLVVGIALAAAAFATLSVGVVQQRLPAEAPHADWSDGATILATPPAGRTSISRHEIAATAASSNVEWTAPIAVVGMTVAPPAATSTAPPVGTGRQAPAGFLVIGVDPLGQEYATGLAESLTDGTYLKGLEARESVWPIPVLAVSLDGRVASPGTTDVAGRPVDVVGVVSAAALTELLAPVAAHLDGLGYDGAFITTTQDAQRLARAGIGLSRLSAAAMVVQASGRIGTPVYAERVRVAAEAILLKTDLNVSIDGRPASLTATFDLKSSVLILILLLVAAAFVSNATTAALNVRRRELATLATLGWSRGRIVMLIATENSVIGLAASCLAAVLSLLLMPLTVSRADWLSALWAIPAAMILSVVGSAIPTWLAASVSAHRRAPRRFGSAAVASSARPLSALALRNVRRFAARSIVAAVAIGISTAVLVMVCIVSWQYGGAAVGSLGGFPLAIQIGPLDVPAACTLVLLSCLILADVVALNLRDRRRELATLIALGWRSGRIRALVLTEAAIVAGLGVLVGATIATAACGVLLSGEPRLAVGDQVLGYAVVGDAAAVAAATIVLALALAVLPVAVLRTGFRVPADQS